MTDSPDDAHPREGVLAREESAASDKDGTGKDNGTRQGW